MMIQKATEDVWIKTLALVTAGTEGTVVRAHPAAQGATEEAAAQAKGSPLEREGEPLAQTKGVLQEVGMKVEGAVTSGEVGEVVVIKDKTAHPAVVTTPSALSRGCPAQWAAALSWWRV